MTDEEAGGVEVVLPEVTIKGSVEEGQAYVDGQAAAIPGGSQKLSAVDRAHADAYRQGYFDKASERAAEELDEGDERQREAEQAERLQAMKAELFKDPIDR
jgi:hypothetical protein